jgi:hypothetical protein
MTAPLDEVSLVAARLRNLRRRNLAVGLAIGFLAVLFYAIAIVKLGPEALRPL